MSQPPPSSVADPHAIIDGEEMPFGRPVRRRVAVPAMLAIGLVLAGVLMALHDPVRYYRVDSGSMEPTLAVGSRVAVEPGRTPEVGDIVVFHPPIGATPVTPVCAAPGEGAGFSQPCGLATPGTARVIFVKRIVAGPGDLVALRAGQTIVNGVPSHEPFAAIPCEVDCDFPTPIRVPASEFYVLGDNRGASDDSRFWGPIPRSSIVGVLVNCQLLQTDCQPRR